MLVFTFNNMEPTLFQALYPHLLRAIEDWSLLDTNKLLNVSKDWHDAFESHANSLKEYKLVLSATAPKELDVELLTLLNDNYENTDKLEDNVVYAAKHATRIFGNPRDFDGERACQAIKAILAASEYISSYKSNRFVACMTVLCVKHYFRFIRTLFDNKSFKRAYLDSCLRLKSQFDHLESIRSEKEFVVEFLDKAYRSVKFTSFKG